MVRPGERVGFPAALGVADGAAAHGELEAALGRRVFEVPTLPPSVSGIRLFEALRGVFGRPAGAS